MQMIDRIDTSNENLEDITKALEDMDSLDMELFKRTKSSTSIYKDSSAQLDGETKKKVIFKDSNDDDLLPGLLSDEETSSKGKKNLFTSNSKSSLIEDLFKIKSPVVSTNSIRSSNDPEVKFHSEQGETQAFLQKPNNYSTSKSNLTTLPDELFNEKSAKTLKNVSKNEDDIIASLTDKSDTVDKSSKSFLRDSLFENKSHTSSTPVSIIPRNINRTESEVMIESTNASQELKSNYNEPSTKFFTRESRRGRRNTKIINDPLGLLSGDLLSDQNLELITNDNLSIKDHVVQGTKSEKDLPEWLGGSKKFEDKKVEVKEEEAVKNDKIPTFEKNIVTQNVSTVLGSETSDVKDSDGAPVLPEHLSMLFGTQLNQQNAFMNMQQQEHELRTTVMVSQQNEQLSKVSNAQHSLLHNQEERFNTFLKLQLERQALLEKQIKMQQERINQYIHALMVQPMPISNTTIVSASNTTEKEESGSTREETENIIKKLEGEKSKLELKLFTINEKHDKEITFQAEFYERQISFLKEALLKSEERVKQDMEYLEINCATKLEKLRDEKLQTENQYKKEIHNLKNEHAQRIEELCKLHSENIKLLQAEYSNIIQSISRAKQTEDETIQAITSQKTDIEYILEKASVIIENMVEKKKELETDNSEIQKLQKNLLKVYENDITTQTLELKHRHSTLEEQYNKFVETTEKYNVRLTQLITEFQKQSTSCNQVQETVERQTANLLREKELFEDKMKWERDYMQALKESWVKEQEKQQKLLTKEREAIAKERAQLEVLSKLRNNSGELAKIELEAAIKTAQESTASANLERLKWKEKINELNFHKQKLQDTEDLLISRAKELETLTQAALAKKEEGIKALKDAKHLENENKEKFNQLQKQIQSLMEREKRIATERFNITRDRMTSIVYEEPERPERDLNVSHIYENGLIPFPEIQSKSEIATELMSVMDPNLLILKLNLNDEID
ncbi:protein CROWDED NUCLEI 4-like, partial [Ceratina calcarata]|uniref:Protein CROWDED NUCLEI 4-like n=1 Tax=Ceratina calcarata TaxID=156304 RepID=A0AAJ7SBJ3_9HYME